MEFTRLGEHKVRCLISEEEINDMGYTMEEILKNGIETQKFMDHIFNLAEHQLDMKFTEGIKTVRADFMANHTLSLTFSTISTEGMMGHLKDVISSAVSAAAEMSPEELEKLLMDSEKFREAEDEKQNDNKQSNIQNGKQEEKTSLQSIRIQAAFEFRSFDVLLKIAENMKHILPASAMPENSLYKYQSLYYLIMDLSGQKEEEVLRIAMLTDEFADDFWIGASSCAFLMEHGQAILKKEAIQELQKI